MQDFLVRMGRRSEATRLAYGCGLDAFKRCFPDQSVDLLVAKIKSGELDAYVTLDKVVGWLTAQGAAPKTIWNYAGAVKSLLEHEDVLLTRAVYGKLLTIPRRPLCHASVSTCRSASSG